MTSIDRADGDGAVRYEVQTHLLGGGWANTWFYDDGDGLVPETFKTRADAAAALAEFAQDIAEQVAAGQATPIAPARIRIAQVTQTTSMK
jgi:hypothetical protein